MPTQPCKHLRTKKLFIPELEQDALKKRKTIGATEHCWCSKSMTEVGLDDRRVALDLCSRSDRQCYRK